MLHCIFWILIVAAIVLPFWFVISIWRERKAKEWNWITKDSRSMYVKVLETGAGAAVISSSVISAIVSNAEPRPHPVVISIRWSVVCLIGCIIFALIAILALSRGYDRAHSRFLESDASKGNPYRDQGQLNDVELCWILVASFLSLVGFLVGFLFLGRIAFQI